MEKINLEDGSLSLSRYTGGLLRTIRCETGLSGHELAKSINISQQQVSRYERGVTNFQLDMLFRFFSALGMSEHERQCFLHLVINKAEDIPQYKGCRNALTDTDILLPDYQ